MFNWFKEPFSIDSENIIKAKRGENFYYKGKLPNNFIELIAPLPESFTKQVYIKRNSITATRNIYESFTKEEVAVMHPSIKAAWRIGKAVSPIVAPNKYYTDLKKKEKINETKI